MDYKLWALLIITVPLAVGTLAVVLDKRSQRGYALGALAIGTLVLAIWGLWAFSQAASAVASSADSLEVVAYALIYMVGELCLAVALTLCAVVVTLRARDWWWLGGIVVVSVVSAVVVLIPPAWPLSNLLDALGLPRGALVLLLTLPLALVTFVYAMACIIRRPLAG